MKTLLEQTLLVLWETAMQVVPPAIVVLIVSTQLSEATGLEFSQMAGLVTAGTLICATFGAARA